jgi:hypothetical protein
MVLHWQVYLPAIAGHVPSQMVRALSAFLDFCYLVRRSVIDEHTLAQIEDSLCRFHQDCAIFETTGVRATTGLCPPRQHSMVHYCYLIQQFGAPNGLCSSITESKHIKAVKEPYRRSNRYNALGQMLLTNQRLDKLAASRVDFTARGMMKGPLIPQHLQDIVASNMCSLKRKGGEVREEDEDDDEGAVEGPTYVGEVHLAKCAGWLFYSSLWAHIG